MDISIQNQYQNTNIEELIKGIVEIRKKHKIKAVHSLRDDVMNLVTAKGDALDMWGRLLNFSRFIPVDSEEGKETFKNFTFYDRNFLLLKFYSRGDLIYAKLSDDAYRQVLQIIYYNHNTQSNIYEASKLASEIFKNRIIVGDSQNMDFVTFYFKEEMPKWMQWVLTKYDILPRPVCVGTRWVSAMWKIFGFKNRDAVTNSKLTAFFNAQFKGNRKFEDASGTKPIPYNNTVYDDGGG